MALLQGPGSQPQEKPVHVPPPMMEAVITVPAKNLPSQKVHKLEEVAASTPLTGTLMHTELNFCKPLLCPILCTVCMESCDICFCLYSARQSLRNICLA